MNDVSQAMISFDRRTLFGFAFGALIGVFAILAYVADFDLFRFGGEVSYRALAERAVAACADADYRPSCYDEEIPKFMDEGLDMNEAFAVTSIVQELDPTYQYCHILGHELSAKETAKDPENWKDVIARAPMGICSNGAIHGAFQERFRVESLEGHSVEQIESELTGICEPRDGWQPSELGIATCTHALGHLTMYVTGADIHDSLALCDRLIPLESNDSKRQLCYDGAFMQIYQPLEPEDEALVAGKEIESKAELEEFCGQFTDSKYGSCVTEGWPLYREVLQEPEHIVSFCDRVNFDDWQHTRCLSGIFFLSMASANLSVEWAESFCPDVESPYEGTCFANAAARLVETDTRNIDRALALCRAASETEQHEACFDKMLQYSTYAFETGSPEFHRICDGMPDPWQTTCRNEVPDEDRVVP